MKLTKAMGQALPSALMALGLVGITAAAVPRVIQYMNKRNQTVKVINAMAAVEQRLRIALSDPSYYTGCPAACALVGTSLPASLQAGARARAVMGADCKTTPGCGIKVDSLNMVGNQIEAKISYEGVDVVVKPTEFSVRVPGHTSGIVECPQATPVFLGLDVDGNRICAALATCGAGQFVKSYDPMTLAVQCETIPNQVVGCAGSTYMSSLGFGPDLRPSFSCAARRTQ
jgi:hypothetical protein